MIDSYSFGRIVIDERRYTADVIVFPDRVLDNWWRKEGHRLHVEDLKEAFEAKPDVLIVGTGYYGLVKVPPETKKHIETQGIRLVIQPTTEACKTYNRLEKPGMTIVAALHLAC